MKNSITKTITRIVTLIFLLLLFVNIVVILISNINDLINTKETSLKLYSKNLITSISAPLSRGNFYEVENIIKNSEKPYFVKRILLKDKGSGEILAGDYKNLEKLSRYNVFKVPTINYNLHFIWERSFPVSDLIKQFSIGIIIFLAGVPLFFVFTKRTIQKMFKPLLEVSNNLKSNFEMKEDLFNEAPLEIKPLLERIREANVLRNEYAVKEAELQISRQVAHDIKSPLAALEIVLEDMKNLPEDSRELTLNAINRIQEIADNLSKNSIQGKKGKAKKTLISVLLTSIFNEKKIEYQGRENFELRFEDHTTKTNFISLVEGDFSRAISNLINNAIEAMDYKGSVGVDLFIEGENSIIKITDTGKGFPPEVLLSPNVQGRSIGKKEGQGLGLFHAINSIESYGGNVKLSNLVGGGAEVLISLPLTESPLWFKDSFNISGYKKAIVIDDDKSIHDVWKKLFKAKYPNLEISDAYTVSQAKTVLGGINDETIVLIDYDLRHSISGIELIQEYNLQNVALVTSNYDTKSVVDFCTGHGVQLIPKQLVSSISLN